MSSGNSGLWGISGALMFLCALEGYIQHWMNVLSDGATSLGVLGIVFMPLGVIMGIVSRF